jgi:erythromycin esterase-like protein
MATRLRDHTPALDAEQLIDVLRRTLEPLPAPDSSDFGAYFDRFGNAQVVLLGEASHGTAEFYRARAAITRRLIENHGFNIVAVEADWPDAAQVDRFVRHRAPEPTRDQAFARFPTWMWANAEVENFAGWLRRHNEHVDADHRVEFRGLDVYSLGRSIDAVLRYLDSVSPEAAKVARSRYGCLTPWQDDPAQYGRAALEGKASCEAAVIAQLQDVLDRRLSDMQRDEEGFFDATQNARIVRAAERYYRIMYRGSTESWNLRDRHMFDTLQRLLQRRGANAKAVVWAHNSHIGNASATSMGWAGEFNIGELCRTAYGHDAVLIGMSTDRGTVAAASEWDAPMEIKTVLPARPDSYEHAFRRTGAARFLANWRAPENRELAAALSTPRLQRAIGVIYRPETEYLSHYFEAVLADQFDALVWFEDTHAITPLPEQRPVGAVETYPFGM